MRVLRVGAYASTFLDLVSDVVARIFTSSFLLDGIARTIYLYAFHGFCENPISCRFIPRPNTCLLNFRLKQSPRVRNFRSPQAYQAFPAQRRPMEPHRW